MKSIFEKHEAAKQKEAASTKTITFYDKQKEELERALKVLENPMYKDANDLTRIEFWGKHGTQADYPGCKSAYRNAYHIAQKALKEKSESEARDLFYNIIAKAGLPSYVVNDDKLREVIADDMVSVVKDAIKQVHDKVKDL